MVRTAAPPELSTTQDVPKLPFVATRETHNHHGSHTTRGTHDRHGSHTTRDTHDCHSSHTAQDTHTTVTRPTQHGTHNRHSSHTTRDTHDRHSSHTTRHTHTTARLLKVVLKESYGCGGALLVTSAAPFLPPEPGKEAELREERKQAVQNFTHYHSETFYLLRSLFTNAQEKHPAPSGGTR